MSPGRRSGVNWIRLVSRPRVLERPLTSSVFPKPGRPSRRMWPRARSPVMTRSMSCSCPKRTWLRAAFSERMCSAALVTSVSDAYSIMSELGYR